MHEDILDKKRISIMFDVITREGFEFSTAQMHCILGEERRHLTPDIYSLRGKYRDNCSEFHGYSVLIWGCSSDGGTGMAAKIFAKRLKEYYEYIGDMEYYRGLIDELR